jgi:hypothetical protein
VSLCGCNHDGVGLTHGVGRNRYCSRPKDTAGLVCRTPIADSSDLPTHLLRGCAARMRAVIPTPSRCEISLPWLSKLSNLSDVISCQSSGVSRGQLGSACRPDPVAKRTDSRTHKLPVRLMETPLGICICWPYPRIGNNGELHHPRHSAIRYSDRGITWRLPEAVRFPLFPP